MAEGSQWAETGVGAAVIAAAAGFLVYALSQAGMAGGGSGRYELQAKFGQVGGLATGGAVSLAGVKIGQIAAIDLDPKTFLAKVRLSIRSDVKLPTDSTVKVTQDSLLGGQHLSIEPGGAADDMKPGAEFQNVQGAVDLFGLIGQVIRPPAAAGDAGKASAGASSATGAASGAARSADPYPGA